MRSSYRSGLRIVPSHPTVSLARGLAAAEVVGAALAVAEVVAGDSGEEE
jgi:hypothetical protein